MRCNICKFFRQCVRVYVFESTILSLVGAELSLDIIDVLDRNYS